MPNVLPCAVSNANNQKKSYVDNLIKNKNKMSPVTTVKYSTVQQSAEKNTWKLNIV